ncbi:LysR family transcriptional regulator [Roseateles sp. DAIF2]|uniref:LysR family transcriptional regulator n=1 Tax=Roseateles sp. DAIF2 TaxID=2714952 RepID=UPI0018A2F5DC|nr:LysR family transcriptional regulator [Roseateles sp. DAIF2]QPF71534.1 LysR family transcriptional regulator [Roseateles sp. DAIF2]
MDIKRLDLNLLLSLEALLQERNVTRAAARLHLSQPALSAQLNRLRDLLGDPLLIPAHRGMTPTAKALQLLEPLRQSLDQLRGLLASHRDFDPAHARLDCRIACTDYLQAVAVLPLIRQLSERAPGIRIALRHLDPQALGGQLERGELDLALMTPPTPLPARQYAAPLFNERYLLIGRRNHPRLRPGLSLADYLALEHVVVSLGRDDFVTAVDRQLAAGGLARRVAVSAASFLLVPEIVAATDGVALVPERLVRDRAEQLQLLEPPLPVPGFAVGMLWHEHAHGHPGQAWIRGALAGLFGG